MRPGRSRGRRDGGFTLIEALVAFAITAMLFLVVQRGLVQARIGWAAIEDRRQAERLARSLFAEPVSLAAVVEGGRSGVTDGRRWTIKLATLDLSLPTAPPPPKDVASAGGQNPAPAPPRWQPLRVTIAVETSRGRPVEVETVRLAPIAMVEHRAVEPEL